jgi:Asp-tRNA(Asn)/Glu-tRNA(Gln) amidotransferase C subunit
MKSENNAAPRRHLIPGIIARQLLKDFEDILGHYDQLHQVELAEHLVNQLESVLEYSRDNDPKHYKLINKREDKLLKKYGKALKPFSRKQFENYYELDLLLSEKAGFSEKDFNDLPGEEQVLSPKEIEHFIRTSQNLLDYQKRFILLETEGAENLKAEEPKGAEKSDQDKDATRSRQLLAIYFLLKAGFNVEHRHSNFVSDSAKFGHLLTGTKFTSLSNSEIYKKFKEMPI